MTLNSVLFTSHMRRKTCCVDHQTNKALNNWSQNPHVLTDLPMKKRNLQFQMSVTAISKKKTTRKVLSAGFMAKQELCLWQLSRILVHSESLEAGNFFLKWEWPRWCLQKEEMTIDRVHCYGPGRTINSSQQFQNHSSCAQKNRCRWMENKSQGKQPGHNTTEGNLG